MELGHHSAEEIIWMEMESESKIQGLCEGMAEMVQVDTSGGL